MDILYVNSPRSSSGLQETLTTLRERCRHIPDATLREMTLDTFAEWYTENAQKQPPDRFDLQIVECSLDSLHDQIWAYQNAFHPDKDWNQIVAESAMGALTWARIGCECVVFVHDGGEVTESIREELRSFPWMTLATRQQVADVGFLHDAAFRVDLGLKAVRSLQQTGLYRDDSRQWQAFDVPPHIARFVAQTFENDAIHRWLFELCGSLFGKRCEAARTLCVISRYARRVVTESLEGVLGQQQGRRGIEGGIVCPRRREIGEARRQQGARRPQGLLRALPQLDDFSSRRHHKATPSAFACRYSAYAPWS
jgi:hypothetical protein